MTQDAWLGVLASVSVIAAGAALVVMLRRLVEWWKALPPRAHPPTAARERLARVWRVWVAALGIWGLTAAVSHYAPRGARFDELLFGLPELLGLAHFASRLAFGLVCAATTDAVLWPRFSGATIVWPLSGGNWSDVPVALRAVALALWGTLYLVIIAGAVFGIEAVL